ncbi:AlbA family DNA-binding domain-containing protein [Flavobacterium micromati]|nr:ATP-binding protein [Flavobacterium micromati]
MLSKSQLTSHAKPSIHYVVRGRLFYSKETKSMIPFEQKFEHLSPILAREKAFSFYKNYMAILEETKQLLQEPLRDYSLFVKNHFGEPSIQKYSYAEVNYVHPESYDKGIAVYMVVQNSRNSSENSKVKSNYFLIHGIWNFNNIDIKNFTNGLIKEFSHYRHFNYDLGNHVEIVDFSVFDNPNSFSIISTPFNWSFNFYLNKNNLELQKSRRIESVKNRIKSGNLIHNEFLSALNLEFIIRTIASFLNEKGGFLFLGVDKYRKSTDLFTNTKISIFKKEIQIILQREFKMSVKKIKLSEYKVGINFVLIFEVLPSYQKGIFLKENNQKVFYRRNNNGFFSSIDPEAILNFCIRRNENFLTIQEILKWL